VKRRNNSSVLQLLQEEARGGHQCHSTASCSWRIDIKWPYDFETTWVTFSSKTPAQCYIEITPPVPCSPRSFLFRVRPSHLGSSPVLPRIESIESGRRNLRRRRRHPPSTRSRASRRTSSRRRSPRTAPWDACRATPVSPAFRPAADSDTVWARFVPRDLRAAGSSPPRRHPRRRCSCASTTAPSSSPTALWYGDGGIFASVYVQ